MAPLRGDMHPTVFLQYADKPAAVPFQTNSLLCINIHNKFSRSKVLICAAPYRTGPFLRPRWHAEDAARHDLRSYRPWFGAHEDQEENPFLLLNTSPARSGIVLTCNVRSSDSAAAVFGTDAHPSRSLHGRVRMWMLLRLALEHRDFSGPLHFGEQYRVELPTPARCACRPAVGGRTRVILRPASDLSMRRTGTLTGASTRLQSTPLALASAIAPVQLPATGHQAVTGSSPPRP